MNIRPIHLIALIMFASGIVQADFIGLPWRYFRIVEPLHIAISILLLFLFVIPFLIRHINDTYRKSLRSNSGIATLLLLIAIVLSGLYLFFIGNRGGDIYGIIAHAVHLYGSLVFLFLYLAHTRARGIFASLAGILVVFAFLPNTHAKEPLSNIVLDEGVLRYHSAEWTDSVTCKACHGEIFKQWANSNHRHMADTNPYYMVLENLAGMDMGEEFRTWCMGCHNPSAVTLRQKRTTHRMEDNIMPEPLFTKDGEGLIKQYEKTHKRLEQGVSCIACHRIVEAKAKGNSSFTLAVLNRERYLFEDAKEKTLKRYIAKHLINANPTRHKNSYMRPFYGQSSYCASCHEEFLPHSGKKVVSTYAQWRDSEYNNPNDKTKHKSCADCHMRYIKDATIVDKAGYSTDGGRYKKSLRTHYFSGANHFLAGLKSKEHEQLSIELLKSAAKLDLALKDETLLIGVTNSGAGHKLPTGAADFRELWLDIAVKDATGAIVYSSGKLDKSGNIEQDSIIYNKVFGDKEGNPVGLFFWRYEKLLKDTRLDPKERRVEQIKLKKGIRKPLQVDVKLNFRIYPQWVTDVVKTAYPQLPDPPVVTIARIKGRYE